MATITYQNGNQGIWLLQDLFLFETLSQSPTEMVLQYDAAELGPYNPTLHPMQYKLTLLDAETAIPGDPAVPYGEEDFTGGTLTTITAFDHTGNEIAKIDGLEVPLAMLQTFANIDAGNGAQKLIFSEDMTITGSDDSGNVITGANGDTIRTGFGDDDVSAGRGYDIIADFGGTDVYRGGKGQDTVTYENWLFEPHLAVQGVNANLKAEKATGPDGHTDTLISIERVIGSFLDDTLQGDAEDNVLSGLQGDDFINGRNGFDVVDYSRDAEFGGRFGIVADLRDGTVRDGFFSDDTLQYIEGVVGTGFDDVIRDNKQDNYLEGGAGWDVLRSAKGNDTLSGGTEDDMFVFIGNNFGHDVIIDWDAFDFIMIENAGGMSDLTIHQVGTSAHVDWNGNTVEILGTDATALNEYDFVFQ